VWLENGSSGKTGEELHLSYKVIASPLLKTVFQMKDILHFLLLAQKKTKQKKKAPTQKIILIIISALRLHFLRQNDSHLPWMPLPPKSTSKVRFC
jgi:hypothetical protein